MTTAQLLSDLVSRGIELRVRGDNLCFRPAERLNSADIESIRRHKVPLLRLLRAEGAVYRNPAADPRPHLTCDRCEATDYRETPIHDGQSLRRDCARCHRFLGWPCWYGQSFKPREAKDNGP